MKTFATCLTIVLISDASLALAQNGSNCYGSRSQTKAGYGVPQGHYFFLRPALATLLPTKKPILARSSSLLLTLVLSARGGAGPRCILAGIM